MREKNILMGEYGPQKITQFIGEQVYTSGGTNIVGWRLAVQGLNPQIGGEVQ